MEPAADWHRHALARRLPPERLDQLVADYQAGDGCTTLAARYGVSENGVLAHLARCGVERRGPGKVSLDDVVEMARLCQAGWTYQAIGERFGVTRVAVKRRLDRFGNHPSPPG